MPPYFYGQKKRYPVKQAEINTHLLIKKLVINIPVSCSTLDMVKFQNIECDEKSNTIKNQGLELNMYDHLTLPEEA